MDFSTIIITLDYYIRKVMALLEELMQMFGSPSETPETPEEAE